MKVQNLRGRLYPQKESLETETSGLLCYRAWPNTQVSQMSKLVPEAS